MKFKSWGAMFLSLISLTACHRGTFDQPSKTGTSPSAPIINPRFTELKNIPEAPKNVQEAARAVFRIKVDGGSGGTGSFVSGDGLMMTNNHVLGIDEDTHLCAREGCYVSITTDYQVGLKHSENTYFAEPLAVDPAADVSFFQIWLNGEKKVKLTTPNFLTFKEASAESLMGSRVHLIGHPQLVLKKWATGQVSGHQNHFATVQVFSIGGHSGSPILNDEMKIVGILHHGTSGETNLTRRGQIAVAEITASRELLQAFAQKNAGDFPSLSDPQSEKWIRENHMFYYRSRAGEARSEKGEAVPLRAFLAESCDKVLDPNRKFKSIEDYRKQSAVCQQASSWWSCSFPDISFSHQYCPTGEEADQWRSRIHRLHQRSERYSLSGGLSELIYLASLELRAGQTRFSLQSDYVAEVLQSRNYAITFSFLQTVVSLRGTNVKIGQKSLLTHLREYKKVPNYQNEYSEIASLYFSFLSEGGISRREVQDFVRSALADPEISLRQYWDIEESAYLNGLLN